MKKLVYTTLTMLLTLVLTLTLLLSTCLAETAAYDHEALVAAAQAEGKVVVYSTSSRIAKAADAFEAKYGITVEDSNMGDSDLITKVTQEIGGGTYGADVVMAQDSGRVYGALLQTGYLVNYVPEPVMAAIDEKYQNPLTFANLVKAFVYNSEKSEEAPIENLWELTEAKWKNQIKFKDPFTEGVNMNWLTMLTSDEVAEQLAKAYQDYYGKEIELTEKNAGYEFVKLFLNNCVLGGGESTIAEEVGVKGQEKQWMSIIAITKLRFDESKDLSISKLTKLDPFVGFSYPWYVQLASNCQNEAAAKLFVEFLFTEEGFAAWAADLGTYSTNPALVTVDDMTMQDWEDVIIGEDPIYIYNNRAEVEEFVAGFLYN